MQVRRTADQPTLVRNGRVIESFPAERCIRWNPLPDSYHLLAELLRSPMDEYKLVVAQHALLQIEAHTTPVSDQPRVGLLLGQVCEDPETAVKYVVIRAAVPVPDESVVADGEDLTDESWVAIEHEIRRQPRQVVGWYRTRRRAEAVMSPADAMGHVGYFRHPWQSALVVSADLARPGGAFFVFEKRVGRHYCLPFYEMFETAPSRRTIEPHSVINWRNYVMDTDMPAPPDHPVPPPRPPARKTATPRGAGPVLLDLRRSVRGIVAPASVREDAHAPSADEPEPPAPTDLSSPLTVLLPTGFHTGARRHGVRALLSATGAAAVLLLAGVAIGTRGSSALGEAPAADSQDAVAASARQTPPPGPADGPPAVHTMETPVSPLPAAAAPARDEEALLRLFVERASAQREALLAFRARFTAHERVPGDCEPVRAAYRLASDAFASLSTAQRAAAARLTLDHSMRYNKLAADVGEMERDFRRSTCRYR